MGKLEGCTFISYVREDSDDVDWLQRILEAAGVPVWRDTASLWPGENWRVKIREAITRDALVFIACFSTRSVARQKSYQNEELSLAIEQLRVRRPDTQWLIPVRFDDCDVPALELGPSSTLTSLHRVDLFGVDRDVAAERLVAAVLRILEQRTLARDPQAVAITDSPISAATGSERAAAILRRRNDVGGATWAAPEDIKSTRELAKDTFIARLRLLRQESGHPSLAEIARRSQGKLSRKTIDDHLSGRRAGVPDWRFTSAYVQACQEFARSTGLRVERLGTLEEWRVRWQAAHASNIAASAVEGEPSPITIIGQPQHIAIPQLTGQSDTTAEVTSDADRFRVEIPRLRSSLPIDHGMIIMANGPGGGTRFEVSRDLLKIGRGTENDIVLPDAMVSRRHAVIRRYGSVFTVQDIGSINGTYLHQRKLTAETPIPSGEELQVGPFRMWFIQGMRPWVVT